MIRSKWIFSNKITNAASSTESATGSAPCSYDAGYETWSTSSSEFVSRPGTGKIKAGAGTAKASFSRDSATAGSTGSNATAEVAGYSLATRSTRSLSAPISGSESRAAESAYYEWVHKVS